MDLNLEAILIQRNEWGAGNPFQSQTVPLKQGIGLVPVTPEWAQTNFGTGGIAPFQWLTPVMATALQKLSAGGQTIAYIEADMHGVVRHQRAVIWRGGGIIMPPTEQIGIVDAVLQTLGARRTTHETESEVTGILRCKHTEAWMQLIPRAGAATYAEDEDPL
jgi:hypothetical protein